MMRVLTTVSVGGRRPKVCVGQDQKTKLWGVYRMVPTAYGHTFDRELADGFPTRKVAEAWAKQWRNDHG